MLKLFSAFAPAIALVLIAVLLIEPPSLSPGDRVPTLRLLTEDIAWRMPESGAAGRGRKGRVGTEAWNWMRQDGCSTAYGQSAFTVTSADALPR